MAVAVALSVMAQEFVVKRLASAEMDLSASTEMRRDLTGRPCALLKVQVPLRDMIFEGNVVGTCDYKGGEYWVYLTPGTKVLKVKHDTATPTFITFADHGIPSLAAKTTYIMQLEAPRSQQSMEEVTFKVTPSQAIIVVDNVEHVVDNGLLKISLSCGTHRCTVFAIGYQTQSEDIVVSPGATNKKVYELDPRSAQSTPAAAPVPSQKNVEAFTVKGVTFEMVRVDGGSFMMGSDNGYKDEEPVHSETVSTFYIGKTEVTQALWMAVMGSNPSFYKGQNLPVEKVSWNDCQEFIDRLNRITGRNFRLPTEAEWEYAARGGNRSRGYEYSGSNNIESVGWYEDNSGDSTHPVGSKLNNELGLYDMSGNVREWTSDLWSSNYSSYRNGGSSGSNRVYRGGSYNRGAGSCRSAYRYYDDSGSRFISLGFRLAL